MSQQEAAGGNSAPGLAIARDGEVLSFTLDTGKPGNEVTLAMMDAMIAELRREAQAPAARVLRLRARGPKFCMGRERAGRNVASLRQEAGKIIDFKRALRTAPLISIAEVHADAFGFGFGLAIVSDFALVASTASLAFPEMRHGLPPAAIMAYLGDYALPRAAFPLVLFGDAITPERALEVGLISQVCAPDKLAAEADALTQRVLSLKGDSARRCKEFFQVVQQNNFDQNCRLAVETLALGSLANLEGGASHDNSQRGGSSR